MTGRRRLALAESPSAQRQLVQAIARIRLAPDKPCEVFEQQLRMTTAVLSAVHVTGDVDYEVRFACDSVASLGAVLAGLRGCGGSRSSLPLWCSGRSRGWATILVWGHCHVRD